MTRLGMIAKDTFGYHDVTEVIEDDGMYVRYEEAQEELEKAIEMILRLKAEIEHPTDDTKTCFQLSDDARYLLQELTAQTSHDGLQNEITVAHTVIYRDPITHAFERIPDFVMKGEGCKWEDADGICRHQEHSGSESFEYCVMGPCGEYEKAQTGREDKC